MNRVQTARQIATILQRAILPVLLGLATPSLADAPAAPPISIQGQVEATLGAAPKGTRFGLLVVDEAGKVIVSINPDGRFIPASNTKMFTTAAAYALLPGMDQPDAAGGTQVALRPGKRKGAPDVVLLGRGDARMSSASDCKVDCLATLADAIAAKTKVVGDVIGDDTWFPDQRWSPGMSWNNFGSNDATAASALSLDSNEMIVRVIPGQVGQPPMVTASPYITVANEAVTLAGSKTHLTLEHEPNSRSFRLYGTIATDAPEWWELIGVDDPALFAAWTFAEMLRSRGVAIKGQSVPLHRPVTDKDDPNWSFDGSVPGPQRLDTSHGTVIFGFTGTELTPLARLTPPPLAEDVVLINKVSQNNHAETLLRRIGRLGAAGSTGDGLQSMSIVFNYQVGIPREGYDFSDGSGMSTYNRVSPRAAVILLRWIATQQWGKAWYASLPIAGVDGTLKRRFIGTPLEGNLIAKTGTLNATNAISGTFRAASGRTLTFAFFANDVPDGQSAVPAMEAVLLLIAASN